LNSIAYTSLAIPEGVDRARRGILQANASIPIVSWLARDVLALIVCPYHTSWAARRTYAGILALNHP